MEQEWPQVQPYDTDINSTDLVFRVPVKIKYGHNWRDMEEENTVWRLFNL